MVQGAGAERNNKNISTRAESMLETARAAEVLRKAQSYRGDAAEAAELLLLGSDVEIAQRVATKLRIVTKGHIVYCEGEFYGYSGKCWEAFPAYLLRRYVHTWDGKPIKASSKPVRLSSGQIGSILKEMATVLAESGWFAVPKHGINCSNGFVEFGADGEPRLIAHDPAHRQRHVLEAEWHGPLSIEGSLLQRLLTGCFKGDDDAEDKRDLLGELMGSAATGYATRLIAPKALVLYGQTAENGKSQVIEVCRGMLPQSAVSAVPPTKFGDDTYRIKLAGKLLNTSDELGSAGAIGSDMFKYLVTGEQVSARGLYAPMVDFRSTAQHVFASNGLPAFRGGMDQGVLRRLLVLQFNRKIPKDERIAHLAERILRDEMPLVLAWVVEGAARLLRQGAFTVPASSDDALMHWAQRADAVHGWAAERLVHGPTYRLSVSEAYDDFTKWAAANGHQRPPTKKTFSERLTGSGLVTKGKSGLFRGWVGVRLAGLLEQLAHE